jgi:tetratricopeptide (TPR) repeat protein
MTSILYKILISFLAITFFAVLSAGCDGSPSGKANPYYLRGLTLRQSDEFSKAAESFEKCLRINPEAAESHLQLGMIYEDHLDSPIKAMFHYKMYLEHQPDGQNADVARTSIQRLTEQIITDNVEDYPELVAAFSQESQLQEQIKQLKEFRQGLIDQIRKQSQIIQALRKKIGEAETK